MNNKFTLSVISFVLLALALFAVNIATSPKGAKTSFQVDSGELVIALVPEKNVFEQKKRYHYITDYLSHELNVPVRAEIMSDYSEICQVFLEGKADIGFFGSLSYGLARAKALVEPIARPVWLNGSSTYSGYLFVRKDSGIKSVEDMKGERLALVHKATIAGYIFPLEYFREYGIDDLEEHFSKVHFCGSHDAAAWVVYSGEAEVGACKNHIFNSFCETNSDFKEQMVVLAESGEVPSNGMAVRIDLAPSLKIQLKQLLLNMHTTKEGIKALNGFNAKRFIETTDQDYMPLYRMIDELGIDLQTYGSDQSESVEVVVK